MQKRFFQLLISCYISLLVSTESFAQLRSYNFEPIDELLYQHIHLNNINGAVVFILKDNQPIYKKSYGYRNELKDSLQFDDIFRMASQTKAITSVIAMQLIEENKLGLYDPLEKYIPHFKNPQVVKSFDLNDTSYTTIPAKRSITTFDLLTHTSGIGYATIGSPEAVALYDKFKISSGVASNQDTLAVVINRLAKLPLFHQPGEKWTYGLNLEVLGHIIEVIEGDQLENIFRKRLFKPLGMNSTYFTLPKELQPKLVTIYSSLKDQGVKPLSTSLPDIGPLIVDYPNYPNTYQAGGAGLSGSIEDYGKFLSMLLNKGKWNQQQLLKAESVQQMTTHQIGDIPFDGEFGLGFQINGSTRTFNEYQSIGTYQWGGAFGTTYWVDPKENLIVLLYTNVWPREYPDFNAEFQKLIYQIIRNPQ